MISQTPKPQDNYDDLGSYNSQMGYPYMDYDQTSPQHSASSIIFQLSSTNLLIDIEHKLRGEIFDATAGENGEWIQTRQALMNEKGIGVVMSILSIHLSHFNVLSILTQDEINRICFNISTNLSDALYTKSTEFEIDKAFFLTLVDTIDNVVYINLKRALNGKTLDLVMKTQKRVENVMSNAHQNNTTMMGRLANKLRF